MGQKILVIDDSEIDFMIVKRYLTQAGYDDIVYAMNAKDGMKKFEEVNPDLVILDTLLPGTNGFEICQEIRQKYQQVHPKVVITTGSVDAVDAVRARRSGADDYCAKTSDCAPLLEAVKKLI